MLLDLPPFTIMWLMGARRTTTDARLEGVHPPDLMVTSLDGATWLKPLNSAEFWC
jgi:hypothetical protein